LARFISYFPSSLALLTARFEKCSIPKNYQGNNCKSPNEALFPREIISGNKPLEMKRDRFLFTVYSILISNLINITPPSLWKTNTAAHRGKITRLKKNNVTYENPISTG